MTLSNQSFAIGKYLVFFCLILNTLQAETTFTINSNVSFNASSGDELSWLIGNSAVSGSGAPFNITVQEGSEWNIHAAVFDTGNLGGATTITIQGVNSYPNGGQLSFTGNGSKLIIHGADVLFVSIANVTGLNVSTHVGHVKIETDCEEYKGNELGGIISLGGVTGNCSPLPQGVQLPVEWASFTVQLKNQHAVVKWETANESDSDHFVVEHSIDGINFAAIGEVEGAGTSNITRTYSFVHKNPAYGSNYYRVKQVDFDGGTNKTQTVSVNVKDKGALPKILVSADYFSVELQDEEDSPNTIFIFDMAGKQIAHFDILPGHSTSFNITDFISGIYVVVVKNDHTSFSQRIFKP